jgi:pyruvate/2-oxoacid:ferredoxin oxidoreductase alpha subunit
MAVATRAVILFARNAQRRPTTATPGVAEATDTPFMVVQDGSLTTHTPENVRLP